MKSELNTIIFSKNRACQLELLLQNLNIPATILFSCDPKLKDGYDMVSKLYPTFKFIKVTSFKKQLVKLLTAGGSYVMFLSDTDVMVRPFWLNCPEFTEFKSDPKILTLSLRLSPDNLWRGLPIIENNKWEWKLYSQGISKSFAELKVWRNLMVVGGHIFRKKDVLPQIKKEPKITTPSDLELALKAHVPNRPLALCFDKSKFIRNITTTPELKLENHFLQGERISLFDIIAKSSIQPSCQTQIPYLWEKYEIN